MSHDHAHHGHHGHACSHAHGHGHSHGGHGHHHGPASYDRAFAIGILLNVGFVVIEAIYGWRADSLALLADAGHNLSDVAGLVLAWAAALAGRLRPTHRRTYGWQRASILAALANAMLLLFAMGALALEAIQRLNSPAPTSGMTVIVVAAIGVVINGVTAALFMAGSKSDLNIRGAFMHMAADALVSLGVVAAGVLYLKFGWAWLDPLVSLAIALVIVVGTWSLFRQSLHLMFDGVPAHVNLVEVRECLQGMAGVSQVSDLHVWAMGTSQIALTAHLVLDGGAIDQGGLLHAAEHALEEHFGIAHVTLQLETGAYAAQCPLHGHVCT